MKKAWVQLLLVLSLFNVGKAQDLVRINDSIGTHVFGFSEIEYLEDKAGTLTLQQIVQGPGPYKFTSNTKPTPQNYHLSSAYWYRVRVDYPVKTNKKWVLEFYDQTIDELTAYIPDSAGLYQPLKLGAKYRFPNRQYIHKNFVIDLNTDRKTESVFYFRVKSQQTANIIIVLLPTTSFVHYAVNEYMMFGIFYGMIVVFAFYNFLMLLAIRQKQYVYYIFYIISVGVYQMCIDGLAYQYLWPNWPKWNEYAYGAALCSVSIFALLFTRKLLNLKDTSPKLLRLINLVIGVRILYFLICFTFKNQWFLYKFVEVIPLLVAFYAGIYTWYKGYRPARFFVIGYGFIFLGFVIKIMMMLGILWVVGLVGYYSLNICFLLEMVFLGFAMGDKVSILKKEKDQAQEERIQEFIINEELKDTLNNKLEQQVNERTKEVIEKAGIIERQMEELSQVNAILELKSAEISRINILLEHDNIELKSSVEKVTRARVMSDDVDFEEFSKIYPDRESCFKFLAELKWNKAYKCRKCGNKQYFNGHTPYSRRCSKCDYDESVTAYTVFQNSHIPIAKAFYMIFLIYSSKGKISSYQLAEILTIRQSTCWAYSNKISKLLAEKKRGSKSKNNNGWSSILLEQIVKEPVINA